MHIYVYVYTCMYGRIHTYIYIRSACTPYAMHCTHIYRIPDTILHTYVCIYIYTYTICQMPYVILQTPCFLWPQVKLRLEIFSHRGYHNGSVCHQGTKASKQSTPFSGLQQVGIWALRAYKDLHGPFWGFGIEDTVDSKKLE